MPGKQERVDESGSLPVKQGELAGLSTQIELVFICLH